MGWTGVDMSTPLLPEVVPEIDANPVSFYSGGGGRVRGTAPGPCWGSAPDPIMTHAPCACHARPPHIFWPGDTPDLILCTLVLS